MPADEEGFYAFAFVGIDDAGMGALVISGNKVTGFDHQRVIYDGTIAKSPSGTLNAQIRMTVPPGVPLVIGVPPQSKEYTIDFVAVLPENFGSGIPVGLTIQGRPVQVSLRKMRDL